MSISSVSEFVGKILERQVETGKLVSYRGHSSTEFRLQPSIFRKPVTRRNEHLLLRELIAAHPEEFQGDASALEKLVRMQHYSLPTRLLDVTFNPLVALYFACEIHKKRTRYKRQGKITSRTDEKNGQVVILTVENKKTCYFDSDKVSCLSNLAYLPGKYKVPGDKSTINTRLEVDDFNNQTPIKRLLHFIRQEKNGFLPEIEPKDLNKILLVKPKQNNKRILAQAGAFFAFGLYDEIETGTSDGIEVERINVKAKSKKKILKELDKLGINKKTMFPEIERTAGYIIDTLE